MLYNVTKIYVLNNEVLYVDEGSISRDSANYNQIDVITNVTGYGVGIAFQLPNGVFSNEFALTQNTGTTTVPSGISQLSDYEGEEWSSYTMLIPIAVLSAITSTTSQTLGFSLKFSKTLNEDEENEYVQVYRTEVGSLSIQGTVGGEPVALDPAWYQNEIVSDLNNLISLYNSLNALVTDSEDGLAIKVNKTGDTMTGTLTFAAGDTTRLVLNNNNVTMDDDAQINATSFSNGDYVSDALKFSDLTSLFDLGTVTPGTGENFLTAYSNALQSKFDQYIKALDLGATVVLTDGTSTMTGNLDMGGKSITNVLNVDGVDVSSLSQAFAALSQTVESLLEVGDEDNAINRIQEIIDVLSGYEEGFDLATELLTKEDKANIGNRTYTEDYVVTDEETVTASIDALDIEAKALNDGKIDIDGANSSLTTLKYIHDDTDPQNIVYSQLQYNADTKVLEFTTPDGTTLQVGGEMWFVNAKTNDALVSGDLVQFAGTQGDHYLVKKAVGSEIQANPEYFVGVATHTANVNDYVKVTWFGEVGDISTDGWSEGDILYFDTITGGFTNVEPTTKPIIQIAAVTKLEDGNSNNGRVLVRPKFISRDAKEVFVDEILDDESNVKLAAATVQTTVETLYDKTQAHEDASNPHGITPAGISAAPATHSHAISDVTDLQTALDSKPTIDDVTGKIPVNVIPFQFDDVLQGYYNASGDQLFYQENTYENVIAAAEGKLYVDISTNDIYRYDGSVYVLVKEAVGALGDIPNVTLTNEQLDDVLKYNGTNWVNGKLDINELEDVIITAGDLATKNYLKWDATANEGNGAWVNAVLDAPVIDSLDAIAGVNATSPNAGDILQYNASTSTWDLNRINFVSDTAPTSPNEGDLWFDSSSLVLYVYYNDGDSTQWVNAVSGIVEGQPEALNDLTDVTLSTLSNGEVLSYNDSTQVFENKKIVEYYTTTIATGDWSGTDPVTAVKTVSGVLSTDKPLIDIDLSSVAFANVETTQTEYAKLYRVAATANDEITFYALEAPTENLTIQIKVVR